VWLASTYVYIYIYLNQGLLNTPEKKPGQLVWIRNFDNISSNSPADKTKLVLTYKDITRSCNFDPIPLISPDKQHEQVKAYDPA
jgi:hypothetical protein